MMDTTPRRTPQTTQRSQRSQLSRILSWLNSTRLRVSIVICTLVLLVVAGYGFLSDYALLSGLFAANIVPTPPDARGSALNDDGTLFALAVSDTAASSALEGDSSLVRAEQAAYVAEYAAQTRTPAILPSAAGNLRTPTTLTAVAHRRVWVRIVRVEHGKRIVSDKFLRAGRRYQWHSDSYFIVSAGFVGGAQFFLNNKPLDALSDRKFAERTAVLRSLRVYQERETIVVRKEAPVNAETV